MAVVNEEKRFYELMNNAPQSTTSAATKSAAADLAAQEKATQNSADYSTTADGKLDAAISSYLNKNGYHYDINNDEAYRAFVEEHNNNALRGRDLSVEGTNALAGGYNPTYAQTVANEVYNDEAAKAGYYQPQFEALAASENTARQQSDSNLINIYNNMASTEYNRGRDEYNDKLNYLSYLSDKYNTERQADITNDQNRATVYSTRLSGAADDLENARTYDNKRYEHDTVSADKRANIAESDYEAALKLNYTKNKDAYDDKVNAAKTEKTNASNDAKTKETAKKAARTAGINAIAIQNYLDGKTKNLTAEQQYDLDYNKDGKIDSKDLNLANNTRLEELLKAGESLKTRQSDYTRNFINSEKIMITPATEGTKDAEILKKKIENANISLEEKAYLYQYFANKYGWKQV